MSSSVPLSAAAPAPPGSAGAGALASRRRGQIVDNGLLGMAIFVAAETMLFAGLIVAFWILRSAAAAWPPPGQPRLPIEVTGVNTLALLASAYTMARASTAARQQRNGALQRALAATAALATIFLAVQGWEWIRLLGYGLDASTSIFAGLFYTLIGCHAAHVAAAVTALVALWISVSRHAGRDHTTRVETFQLYWWFVVGIWPLLYVLVYLM